MRGWVLAAVAAVIAGQAEAATIMRATATWTSEVVDWFQVVDPASGEGGPLVETARQDRETTVSFDYVVNQNGITPLSYLIAISDRVESGVPDAIEFERYYTTVGGDWQDYWWEVFNFSATFGFSSINLTNIDRDNMSWSDGCPLGPVEPETYRPLCSYNDARVLGLEGQGIYGEIVINAWDAEPDSNDILTGSYTWAGPNVDLSIENITPVPLPAAVPMLITGAALLFAVKRRRRVTLAALSTMGLVSQAGAATYEYEITHHMVFPHEVIPEGMDYDDREFDFVSKAYIDTQAVQRLTPLATSRKIVIGYGEGVTIYSEDYPGGVWDGDSYENPSAWWSRDCCGYPQYARLEIDASFNLTSWDFSGEWPLMSLTSSGGWLTDYWYAMTHNVELEDISWISTWAGSTQREILPDYQPAPIPIPATAPMLISGAALVIMIMRRMKKASLPSRSARD